MIEEMKGNVMDLFGDGWKVLAGSCLDRLPELADESVDAVVCDPPYELGFMGKSWDSSGIAYDVNVWRECLRVLKPGGHILAFGGSRTWHRLAVAVEDAGFELRDSIAWLYGSGFPKSLDVSKAIDKAGATQGMAIRKEIQDLISASGLTDQKIAEVANVSPALVRFWRLGERSIQTDEAERITNLLGSKVPQKAEREVIGERSQRGSHSGVVTFNKSNSETELVTAPATVEAQKWAGWGTALKPAFEPVVVGRKPLKGTVAANVLAYGVGGLNIDATRIGTESTTRTNTVSNSYMTQKIGFDSEVQDFYATGSSAGRWPSNVILDEYTAQLVDQQSGISKSSIGKTRSGGRAGGIMGKPVERSDKDIPFGFDDSGGASRFFYIAKANKRDRNEGLENFETKQVFGDEGGTYQGLSNSKMPSQNFHPTVKPTDLMRQLIRLVTPPNGIVLDPFTGSGSTGKAAILEGMQFIGCELTEDYLPIIQGRIEWAVEQVKTDKVKAETDAAEALF